MRTRFLLPWLVLSLALTGCRACDSMTTPDGSADAALPPPPPAPTSVPVPSAYVQDALWERATKDADDIDLAALADREGASGLLEAFETGGKVSTTALAALPFARDAEVAYGRLGQVVLQTRGKARLEVLQSIRAIAISERQPGEPLDPDGRLECAVSLARVTSDTEADAEARALAASILRLPPFRPPADK